MELKDKERAATQATRLHYQVVLERCGFQAVGKGLGQASTWSHLLSNSSVGGEAARHPVGGAGGGARGRAR